MFKQFRLRRLELKRERLTVRVACLTMAVRAEPDSDGWRFRWIDAREDLAVCEKRIEMLKARP